MADESFKKFIEVRDKKSSVYNLNEHAMLTENEEELGQPQTNEDKPHITVLLKSAAKRQLPDVGPVYPREKSMPPSLSTEFADRLRSRPTGRPHVVGLDGRAVTSRSGRMDNRNFNGFFPSLKLRALTPTNLTSSCTSAHVPRVHKSNSSKVWSTKKTTKRVSALRCNFVKNSSKY